MGEIEVELRKHIGIQHTELGPVEVEHDQWYVLIRLPASTGPLHIGYLPHRDYAPILWLPQFTDGEKQLPSVLRDKVTEAVMAKREETVNG